MAAVAASAPRVPPRAPRKSTPACAPSGPPGPLREGLAHPRGFLPVGAFLGCHTREDGVRLGPSLRAAVRQPTIGSRAALSRSSSSSTAETPGRKRGLRRLLGVASGGHQLRGCSRSGGVGAPRRRKLFSMRLAGLGALASGRIESLPPRRGGRAAPRWAALPCRAAWVGACFETVLGLDLGSNPVPADVGVIGSR
jgi:hypothetical protein